MNKDARPAHAQAVIDAISDEVSFIRATFSEPTRGETGWLRLTVRPVEIKGKRMLQFSTYDAKQHVARNCGADEWLGRLEETLDWECARIHVQSTCGDIHVRVTKKGRALLTRGKPSLPGATPTVSHDRVKGHALPVGRPDAYLTAIGVTDAEGHVRPSMKAKFRQINEFLRVLDQVTEGDRPVSVVDCGCGSAHLTFAAYHFLKNVRGVDARIVGIDVNAGLIDKVAGLRDELGWEGLAFDACRIEDFHPDITPDIVLSLHACDTATDEAIAQGVRWGSRVILAAPCCQHELHHQIDVPEARAILRHGILRERLADILTDTFRALALRVCGYRVDVFEFVSAEHTAKNVMVRAVRAGPDAQAAIEYRELAGAWGVRPVIGAMLGWQDALP